MKYGYIYHHYGWDLILKNAQYDSGHRTEHIHIPVYAERESKANTAIYSQSIWHVQVDSPPPAPSPLHLSAFPQNQQRKRFPDRSDISRECWWNWDSPTASGRRSQLKTDIATEHLFTTGDGWLCHFKKTTLKH